MADTGFKIELKGADELITRIDTDQARMDEMGAIIDSNAQKMAATAKRYTSKFSGGYTQGILRNLISALPLEKTSDGFVSGMVSGAKYSAYVEWGTGTKVDVPADLTEYAIQFKGTKAVKGMRAQPFFFVAAKSIIPFLEKDLAEFGDSL